MEKDLNIIWYVLCWNEMPILPFMVDYWKKIANNVIVFDNNSDDGSVEYLKQYDWIEVRPYPIDTHDTLNDGIHKKIKNECWKEQKGKGVDFVIVSDLDEILWGRNTRDMLATLPDDISIIKPEGYDFVSDEFPEYDGRLLHEKIKTCARTSFWDKPIVFRPDSVTEINYCAGGHLLENPVYTGHRIIASNIYLFHFKYLSLDYLIKKRYATKVRMSEDNKRNGWGVEYMYETKKIEEQFNEKKANATISPDDLLKR